jgi:tetratricopeptide (TPR) repeat protein
MVSALLQEQQAKYPVAQQLYDKILVRFPFFAPASKQLAGLYAEHLGDDKKAYAFALKARETLTDDADLSRMLGVLAYRLADYAKSAQYLKEIAGRRNNDAELMYYLGMAQYNLKDSAGSKASLRRALDLKLAGKFATEAQQKLAEMK